MPNILVNLPSGFFHTHPACEILDRLDRLGTVRRRSFNQPDEILGDLAWADYVLMWSWPLLDDSLLDQAPSLKAGAFLDISQRGAEIALQRGLPVSLGRSAFSPAVAEMALTLILACLRRVSLYHKEMAEGSERWVTLFPDDINPKERELCGATVGIVGFGRIGRRLGELLQPFHCRLLVVDPHAPEAAIQEQQAERVPLAEAVEEADILVLCAASNKGTLKLLGREEIMTLKPNALLVNLARAALVDTSALIERLTRGDLTAALDVFDQEPLPLDHPLRGLPNAFLTPHRGGGIMASVTRILTLLVSDLEACIEGRPMSSPLVKEMIPSLDA